MPKRPASWRRRRLVLDTNTWVSAIIFPESVPGQLVGFLRRRDLLLVSAETLSELSEVLKRPKFDRYLPAAKRTKTLARLLREVRLIQVSLHLKACRDPKDDKILSLAVAGRADTIITGDEDLLVLNPFRGVEIVSPGAFLQR